MSDFILGFIIGFCLCVVLLFLLECFCIASGISEKEKWIEEEDDESN